MIQRDCMTPFRVTAPATLVTTAHLPTADPRRPWPDSYLDECGASAGAAVNTLLTTVSEGLMVVQHEPDLSSENSWL
jgi:hypothetical protein